MRQTWRGDGQRTAIHRNSTWRAVLLRTVLCTVIFFFDLLSFSLRCTRLVTSPISMDSDWLIPIYDSFLMTYSLTHLLVCALLHKHI